MYVCLSVCLYVCMYVCMYVCNNNIFYLNTMGEKTFLSIISHVNMKYLLQTLLLPRSLRLDEMVNQQVIQTPLNLRRLNDYSAGRLTGKMEEICL